MAIALKHVKRVDEVNHLVMNYYRGDELFGCIEQTSYDCSIRFRVRNNYGTNNVYKTLDEAEHKMDRDAWFLAV